MLTSAGRMSHIFADDDGTWSKLDPDLTSAVVTCSIEPKLTMGAPSGPWSNNQSEDVC